MSVIIRVLYFETKELIFCHKLLYSNSDIFATRCRRPFIFQTKNYVRSNSQSLRFWFAPSGCKVMGIRKFEFVTRTQFLCYFYDLTTVTNEK